MNDLRFMIFLKRSLKGMTRVWRRQLNIFFNYLIRKNSKNLKALKIPTGLNGLKKI